MIVSLARLALLFRALMCDIALPVEPESNEEWRKRTIREIAVLHARFITRMSEQGWPPVEKSLWTGVVTKGRHRWWGRRTTSPVFTVQKMLCMYPDAYCAESGTIYIRSHESKPFEATVLEHMDDLDLRFLHESFTRFFL